ncbi:hypothetical protein FJW08_21695 [Mesorhizobium sp. B3-2-1]|nr:hypothetical protein FJW08_21695 [Mesorhizobium sp. B3-2-1]
MGSDLGGYRVPCRLRRADCPYARGKPGAAARNIHNRATRLSCRPGCRSRVEAAAASLLEHDVEKCEAVFGQHHALSLFDLETDSDFRSTRPEIIRL